MDWNQIEYKWAAMTRRVRGGMTSAAAQTPSPAGTGATLADVLPSLLSDRHATVGVETRPETSTE